ncbi:movement protein [Rose yellow vein virus]|uniref:Movement protein n=1 Tax=Rose yellow vein virus TaxID=1213588 RepID=I7CKI6_9VIRU|nr:movement protein [Rose yellow vein virus]AFO54489.1 movement protein [Rose yellow vein virus]
MNKLFKSLSVKETHKPNWQIYDKITFEEVDNASNSKLPILPEKVLYETKMVDKRKDERIFLSKSRDYSANNQIVIHGVTKADLESEVRSKTGRGPQTGYYHIAAVQILVKWLGNAGLDIPVKIAIRDKRIINIEKSIMGLWASNLYTGAVYTVLALDLLVSANDKNLEDLIVFDIKADIDLVEGSQALAISTHVYASWTKAPNPFRKRDGEFSLEQLQKGKAIFLKPKEMDIITLPKPIPLDNLNYDLEFNFQKEQKLQPMVSNDVDYKLSTKDEFIVRLKNPRHKLASRSYRFSAGETSNPDGNESD